MEGLHGNGGEGRLVCVAVWETATLSSSLSFLCLSSYSLSTSSHFTHDSSRSNQLTTPPSLTHTPLLPHDKHMCLDGHTITYTQHRKVSLLPQDVGVN